MTVLLRCSMPSPLGPRQVVGEERVVPGSYAGYSPKIAPCCADDLLDVLHERVELGVGAGVMQREAERAAVRP